MKLKWKIAAAVVVLLAGGRPGFSQQQRAPQGPRQTAQALTLQAPVESSGDARQNPYFGSVAQGEAVAQEMALSLSDAIQRGLRNNLGQFLSKQQTRAALAQQWLSRSGLLPNVDARAEEMLQQVNLAAFGFSDFRGLENPLVGPFSIFDARVFLSQSVFDAAAIHNARAGSENLKAANFSYDDARDVVVTVVANLYLQAVAGGSRIEAAQAQVNTAQALYDQAVNFKQAGIVPAIEVLRAQVELQARQQQLIFYRNEFEKHKLALARAIGLPLRQPFRLAEDIPYRPLPALAPEDALARAFQSRSDYQSAMAAARAAELAKKSAEDERLPTLTVNADFGDIGRRITSSHETFTTSASLRIPIFRGGRIRANIVQAEALLEQRRAQLEDLRGRIEYEVRAAFLDLNAAGERVQVARGALDLARQQLEQSRDRFGAGVTGNIEVVQAQEALATANENLIAGTYAYNVAKTALARAMGGAEKNYQQFLGGETQ